MLMAHYFHEKGVQRVLQNIIIFYTKIHKAIMSLLKKPELQTINIPTLHKAVKL